MSRLTEEVVVQGAVLAASLAVVFAACGGTTTSPSAAAAAIDGRSHRRRRRRQRQAAFDGIVYPATGEAPCGVAPVHRPAEEDHRGRPSDGRIPAVRPGRRLPAEDRVQRVRDPGRGLSRRPTRADKPILDRAERHRARTSSRSGARATGSSSRPIRRLLGRQGPDAERRAPLERPVRPAPRRAPVRAPSTGSTTPAPRTSRRSRPTPNLQFSRAPGSEHLVPRLQQHDQAVGRRQGPPGDRHGHRPRRGSSRTSTRQARRRPTTSRRARSRTPAKATSSGLRSGRGQAAPDRRRLPERVRRPRSSSAPPFAAT